MLSPSNLGWLAGLLEGEGCFSLTGTSRTTPTITLVMTDQDVMERAADVMGAPSIWMPKLRPRRKQTYRFALSGSRAVGWMMTLYPFLGSRRKARLRECLDVWRRVPVKRSLRSHCPAGHPLSGQNLFVNNRNQRGCRTCHREQTKVPSRARYVRLRSAFIGPRRPAYRPKVVA